MSIFAEKDAKGAFGPLKRLSSPEGIGTKVALSTVSNSCSSIAADKITLARFVYLLNSTIKTSNVACI